MAGRRFAYNELGEVNPVIVDEDEIRRIYWPYWVEQMTAAKLRGQLNALGAEINWDNCLDEWIVVNWAWEVDNNNDPLNGVDHHAV